MVFAQGMIVLRPGRRSGWCTPAQLGRTTLRWSSG